MTAFNQLQQYIKNILAKVIRYDKILQAYNNWKFIEEFNLSNMFFQMKIRTETPLDSNKLSYLCIQTEGGSLPQGLPGVSEYEEELTDTVFGDMVVKGKMANWADNIYM